MDLSHVTYLILVTKFAALIKEVAVLSFYTIGTFRDFLQRLVKTLL